MTKTQKNSEGIKSLCCMTMLVAIAIVADLFIRVQIQFLTYEPSDVIIAIGGFIFGPIAGLIMSFVVCMVELLTVSDTGIIGLLMNFLSSAVFVGVASLIYSRKKKLSRAILGLVVGSVSMVAVMLLWNYIVTPIYMGVPREAVLELFIPLLVPFNFIKVALNSALVLLLYKGVVTALRKSRLIPKRESADNKNVKVNTIILLSISAFVVATLILVLLLFAGII